SRAHFRRLQHPRAESRCARTGKGARMSEARRKRLDWLKREAKKRILILDGSWGVMFQGYGLTEPDFRRGQFVDHPKELKGNFDLLGLTRPEIVREVADAYLKAGADILETNTFNSNAISQADYGLENFTTALNETAARLAREACDHASTP